MNTGDIKIELLELEIRRGRKNRFPPRRLSVLAGWRNFKPDDSQIRPGGQSAGT
jgi:hypothetical protein